MVEKQKAFSIIELSQRNLSKSLRAGFQEVLFDCFLYCYSSAIFISRTCPSYYWCLTMDYSDSAIKLTEILGLETPPVAVKFLKPGETIPEGFTVPARRMRFCQAVMEASWGKMLVVSPTEMACGPGPGSFGAPVKEKVSKGEVHHAFGLFDSAEAASRCLNANAKMLPGSVSNVLVAPLEKCTLQPDTIIMRVTAEQAMWICQSRSFPEGKHLNFEIETEANICSAMGVAPYVKNELQLGLGCYGSRSNTDLKPGDVLIGMPAGMLTQVVDVLEKLRKPLTDSRAKKGYYEAYPEKKPTSVI